MRKSYLACATCGLLDYLRRRTRPAARPETILAPALNKTAGLALPLWSVSKWGLQGAFLSKDRRDAPTISPITRLK
jgi:hypothetical protein